MRFLDLAVWQLAWDRYALVAASLGQMKFSEAMLHKATVMEVRCLTFALLVFF